MERQLKHEAFWQDQGIAGKMNFKTSLPRFKLNETCNRIDLRPQVNYQFNFFSFQVSKVKLIKQEVCNILYVIHVHFPIIIHR